MGLRKITKFQETDCSS